jgi:hypothetical protein
MSAPMTNGGSTDTKRKAAKTASSDAVAELEHQQNAVDDKITEIRNGAQNGLSAAQLAQIDALTKTSTDLDQGIIKYSLIENMTLNNSAEVNSLTQALNSINISLKKSLEDVNKVVQVINNVNAVVKSLNSALQAIATLAAAL